MTEFSFDVDAAAFDSRVLEVSHRAPVLVDFWADWCAPCRVLKPILEKLAAEYGGRFLLAKVDSDRNPELASRYGVRGIPAVKAFVDGAMANEFTGALPEARVRAFIDALLPSPAEPLRAAARAALDAGDLEAATSLLADAAQLDPASTDIRLDLAEVHLAAHRIEEARVALDAVTDDDAAQAQRAAALRARLSLAAGGRGADAGALAARIAADPGDLDGRLQLARAQALQHDYRAALENLLEIVRRDRRWNDEAGRRTMLDLFSLLAADPRHDELLREFRVRLARTLN